MQLKERGCEVCDAEPPASRIYEQGDSAYYQCSACKLIFASPIHAEYEEANDAAFETHLEKYTHKIEAKLAANRKTLKPLTRYRQTGRFLEIGCNAGAILHAANSLGWQATGVDIAAAPVRHAREVLGLDARLGSLERHGFEADAFDVVYSNAVLEHLEHPCTVLREANRLLRPGGVLFAATVNWDSYTRRLLGSRWRYLEPFHHVHLFTPGNVRHLAEHCGFRVEKIWSTGVRLNDKKHGRSYSAPWYWQLMKGPLSLATRFTNKGDSIKLLLSKP